jgi:uncharacterized membrane protein
MGGWMPLWWGFGLVVPVLLVWLTAKAVGGTSTRDDTPEQILKRRYARGKIDHDEYRRRLEDVRRYSYARRLVFLINSLEDAMMRRLLLVVLGGTMLAIQLVSPAAAQNRQAQPPASPAQSMQDMMKMHEQMMAQMKAGDAKLDALVKEMNAATGNAKVNAIAAVVTELVMQNRSMHEHMGQMHQQMMGGRGMMMNK